MIHEVIYDGDCGICDATRRWFQARDRRRVFRWTPLQDADVYRRHPQLSPAECTRDMHLVASDGSVYRGFAAVRFLAQEVFGAAAGSVLRWPPVALVAGLVYRRVADERHGSLSCSVDARTAIPRRWHRVTVNVVFVVIAVFHVWAIAGPREEWPFTSNAMFAFYVAPDAPAYHFTVYAQQADGTERAIDFFEELGVVWFDRLFFSKWYGSTDPRFPQGHHPEDGEDGFADRMADFGRSTVAALRRADMQAVAIRIDLERTIETAAGATVDTVTIGRYEAKTGRFSQGERR